MKNFAERLPVAPSPTRIDWGSVGGPVLHYEGITAFQVGALDLLLPSDDSWTPGANVVDLCDGRFNVFAAFAVISRADAGFEHCMERVQCPLNGLN